MADPLRKRNVTIGTESFSICWSFRASQIAGARFAKMFGTQVPIHTLIENIDDNVTLELASAMAIALGHTGLTPLRLGKLLDEHPLARDGLLEAVVDCIAQAFVRRVAPEKRSALTGEAQPTPNQTADGATSAGSTASAADSDLTSSAAGA